MKNHLISYFTIGVFILFSCRKHEKITKTGENDAFKSTVTQSQFFDIETTVDNVVEGNNGTIIVLPKGCFLDGNGNAVKKRISIELAEAFTLKEMVLSNLTTASEGELLETGGMIFLNATANGEQLKIDSLNPLYIEMPTQNWKEDMMVYQGKRSSNGNMNWINSRPMDDSLTPIDIFLLDFLPNGFKEEVETGLPFRNFNRPTLSAVDSLYYYLDFFTKEAYSKLDTYENIDAVLKEPYYDNFVSSKAHYFEDNNLDTEQYTSKGFGVDPMKIRAIKTESFQNTLIATREFEKRLQTIFKVCRSDIIDIYINNIDKNMWELDSIAAQLLKGDYFERDFLLFKNERKTKIKGSLPKTKILRDYYQKRFKELEKEKQKLFDSLLKIKSNEEKELKELQDKYKELLRKRESNRMQTYGFTQTNLGWINIDRGIIPKDWSSQHLDIVVENAHSFDKVFTYVFYKSIRSLYRLSTTDKKNFFVGNEITKKALIPINKPAVTISIGYLDDQLYMDILNFQTGSQQPLNLWLTKVQNEELNQVFQEMKTKGTANSIQRDLSFAKKLSISRKEKQNVEKAIRFLQKLEAKAYPSLFSFMRFNKEYQIDLQIDSCDASLQNSKLDIKEVAKNEIKLN